VKLEPAAQAFVDQLLGLELITPGALEQFLIQNAEHLPEMSSPQLLGSALQEAGLLTAYQLDRVLAGTIHGLVLGNYRVLERMGGGSICVVFLAEHFLMKRRVAVKVLPVDDDFPPQILERFYAEMRVLADMHHPNIVLAYDAGRLPPPRSHDPALHYLVMELVTGGDLEDYGNRHGRLPVAQACDYIRQAACGLQEAHDHHLIHRDIKPSNLLLTAQGQVKVVDFGLARQFTSNLTEPRALLGSIEFMAPEQALDATAVSAQADVYGLGATLFWLLTGELPYPTKRSIAEALRALQQERPRRLKALRPDVPPELDQLVDRMLERDPRQRPAMPVVVMNALHRFAAPVAPAWEVAEVATPEPTAEPSSDPTWRVLIVDPDPSRRAECRSSLGALGCVFGEEADAEKVAAVVGEGSYDLVLLGLDSPGTDGVEVCRRLREQPPRPHLKIIALSGARSSAMTEVLLAGADDHILQPFEPRHLAARVLHTLRLKEAQARADVMAHHLLLANRQLEHSLEARTEDVRRAQNALLFAMARMAASREGENVGHLRRLQRYTRCLADAAARDPAWSEILTPAFLEELERCVPLHDIGKIGLPDQLLAKPGPLNGDERALMETHPLIGAGILDAIAKEYGDSLAFLSMATVIVRYHHERWDGQGYPDGLAGEVIPPAARLVAIADVYDALRRKRLYKPPLEHPEAVRILLERSEGQFDPSLLEAFRSCHAQFERIYRDIRA
jgi:response regulator RpfG family c-di-GMP phosphodiesterase/tRNA A-37 threonylcarbamoyl transferase component Bud32